MELNMSFVYCVAQLSFHAHDPLMRKLKGLSLIHVQNYESGSLQSHLQGKLTCSPSLANHWLLLVVKNTFKTFSRRK